METGLTYNYFRDYDPASGRYVESDPIGLRGGVNTYAYVKGGPVSKTDATGLLEQCRSGLDVLQGGDLGALHHEFVCWTGDDGKTVCRGYGRDPSSSVIDAILHKVGGHILKGDDNKSHNTASCGVDDKNKCMDACASEEWNKVEKKTPAYGLLHGESCQSVNESILKKCSAKCHVPAPEAPSPPSAPGFENRIFD